MKTRSGPETTLSGPHARNGHRPPETFGQHPMYVTSHELSNRKKSLGPRKIPLTIDIKLDILQRVGNGTHATEI